MQAIVIVTATPMTFAIANIPLGMTNPPPTLLRLWGGVVGILDGANKFGRASTHSEANNPEIHAIGTIELN